MHNNKVFDTLSCHDRDRNIIVKKHTVALFLATSLEMDIKCRMQICMARVVTISHCFHHIPHFLKHNILITSSMQNQIIYVDISGSDQWANSISSKSCRHETHRNVVL